MGGEGHLPEDHGFEQNVGGAHQGSPGGGGYFSPWTIPPLEDVDVPEGTYLTDYLTDRIIDLFDARDERPFSSISPTTRSTRRCRPKKRRFANTKPKLRGWG